MIPELKVVPEAGKESRAFRTFDPTQIYLKEIGASDLLPAEEEVKYGRLA